jgi:hypothetical protein
MPFVNLAQIVDTTLKALDDPLISLKISVFDDLQNEETRRSFAELLTNERLFKFKEPELISLYNECVQVQPSSKITSRNQAHRRSKTLHSFIKAAAVLKTPAAGVLAMTTSSGLRFEGDHTHSEQRRSNSELPFLPLVGVRNVERYEILHDLVTKLYGEPEDAQLTFRNTYVEVDQALLSMWARIFTTWIEHATGRIQISIKLN